MKKGEGRMGGVEVKGKESKRVSEGVKRGGRRIGMGGEKGGKGRGEEGGER